VIKKYLDIVGKNMCKEGERAKVEKWRKKIVVKIGFGNFFCQ